MSKLRVLDLFSGIGGFSLGLERTGGFETVAFCEIEEFPRKVLKKHWPKVPCHNDVRTLTKDQIDGPVDVICGGYPCQPFSTAGKRKGKEDDRHLWPEISRLVDEFRPAWVIGENVAGHISMGLDDVLSDLEDKGYSCRTFVIPACAVGAYHRRDRTWVIANANDVLHAGELVDRGNQSRAKTCENGDEFEGCVPHGERIRLESGSGGAFLGDTASQRCGKTRELGSGCAQRLAGTSSTSSHVADTKSQPKGRLPKRKTPAHAGFKLSREDVANAERIRGNEMVASIAGRPSEQGSAGEVEYSSVAGGRQGWLPEPDVGRVANGVPRRVDRLGSLGNAVVPQIPEIIGHAILQARAAA